jgi:dimethylamine/trimethylamine dehydrogenase
MHAMPLDARFAPLFAPLRIGPVTAPNRFYQVPHCTGMGNLHPHALAAMRAVKAEGGWGVVNTEYCSIDPTSDDTPFPHCSLWDEGDVRNMAAVAAAVHRHGSLAGVELWHGGIRSSNLLSRATPLGPVSLPTANTPMQCMAMDRADIAQLRRWHREAALRARQAGFDIIYVYAAHTYLLAQFLDPVINQRTDCYGGSVDNRLRLLEEIIEDTREAIAGRSALAIRIEVDGDRGDRAERSEMLARIASRIDLFDVTVADYYTEMGVSRFVKEAALETEISHVRSLTGKPVVSVGRFTSPETMLSQIRRGVLDLIGAARPSIADPFLPEKIREGRLDDIRECIGCNICYAQDGLGVPIRCTQNPAMGEEWRRGWHPERVNVVAAREKALVVGGGPAGLEAALTLGRRGFEVMLAEASREPGGRVNLESRLPGLSEWARVRDWRVHQLGKLGNVEIFRESRMSVEDVVATGATRVLIATGSHWRKNGRGRTSPGAIASFADARTLLPEEIIAGERPAGPVVVYDDDLYVTAGAIAELLADAGLSVTYVTTAGTVSAWTRYTAEQERVQARLIEKGVAIIVSHAVEGLEEGAARLSCVYSGRKRAIPCMGFVPVTSREPEEALWQALAADVARFQTLERIGDCKAPGLIAHAVHDGHRAGRAAGSEPYVMQRERVVLA